MRAFISIVLLSMSVFFVCGREIVLLQNGDGSFEELPQFLEPPKANQVSEYDSSTLEVKKDGGRKKYKPEQEVKKSYEWVEGENFKQWEIDCLMDQGKCNKKLENIKSTILSALSDGCKSCSVPDKILAGNAAAIMMFRQPEVWQQFIGKYDKEQAFVKQHS